MTNLDAETHDNLFQCLLGSFGHLKTEDSIQKCNALINCIVDTCHWGIIPLQQKEQTPFRGETADFSELIHGLIQGGSSGEMKAKLGLMAFETRGKRNFIIPLLYRGSACRFQLPIGKYKWRLIETKPNPSSGEFEMQVALNESGHLLQGRMPVTKARP